MKDDHVLPPGQFEMGGFPRFGLERFAKRFPNEPTRRSLDVGGDVESPLAGNEDLWDLPRLEQLSDFHCVTTWSVRSLRWGGFRFRDFYERIVVPNAKPKTGASFVILKAQDGFAVSLPLDDLMASDVLLADRLDGAQLSIAHGAPLRLVAPAHYGYKNPKHLRAIDFWTDDRNYRRSSYAFMDHPRARVAREERGQYVPGWCLRYLYRPLIRPTARHFARALEKETASTRSHEK